jgi:dCMP deaminase
MKPRETPFLRPRFETLGINIAKDISRRSSCRRLQVGCAIFTVDFQRMLAWGYNGNAAGLPNDCESEEPGRCACVHAEANAIVKCREGKETPKIVICTDLPCQACAKLLINLGGVQKVIYYRDYRIKDSLAYFRFVDIETELFDPNKYKDQEAP